MKINSSDASNPMELCQRGVRNTMFVGRVNGDGATLSISMALGTLVVKIWDIFVLRKVKYQYLCQVLRKLDRCAFAVA